MNDVYDAKFKELVLEYLRPSMRNIMRKYGAQLNYENEIAAYNAIRVEYEKAVTNFKTGMYKQQDAALDTHKEAACLCCGVVRSQVLSKDSRNSGSLTNIRKFPNELFAFDVAMRIVKNSLYRDYEHNMDMLRIIKDEIPVYPKNIIDENGYLSNIIFYIRRFSEYGKSVTREYLFDSGAYATIFFHLDYENRRHISKKYAEVKETA
jgi:hypothetical protein